jgi:hypothetical protein
VTAANYAQIIGGEDAWNKLTDAQKALVNACLKAAGANPDNYTVGKNEKKIAEYIKGQLDRGKYGEQLKIPYSGGPLSTGSRRSVCMRQADAPFKAHMKYHRLCREMFTVWKNTPESRRCTGKRPCGGQFSADMGAG